MAETLKEKTAKGLFWGAMNNGAMQVSDWYSASSWDDCCRRKTTE